MVVIWQCCSSSYTLNLTINLSLICRDPLRSDNEMLVIGVIEVIVPIMYVPCEPRPKWIVKPTTTSNYSVINAAYAGDCLFKLHVRDWLCRHVTQMPTDAHMQKFITNRAMAIYLKKFSERTMREYNLSVHSNIHHFGTAFESEYYTNIVFRQMYWVRIQQLLPLIDVCGEPLLIRDGYNRHLDVTTGLQGQDILESTLDIPEIESTRDIIHTTKDVFVSTKTILSAVVMTVAVVILTLPIVGFIHLYNQNWI